MSDKNSLYVIVGATGNIGSRIARGLLEKGHKVRVVGRSAARLKGYVAKGAEVAEASLEDAAATAKALAGATAIFSMIPPNPTAKDFLAYADEVSESLTKAIKASGAKYAVNLSSVGGQLTSGTGPILGLHQHEKRLNKIAGLNVVHLRPCYFMENLFSNIDTLRNMGITGSPIKGTLVMPMIATRDIAAAALDLFEKLDFSGSSARELLGQRDLTMNEVTKVLAKAINRKDVTYVQFPYAEAEKVLVQIGLSPSYAGLLIEMTKGFNEGLIHPTEERSAANTTPTSIEEFAQGFAEIYLSAAKVEA